jgi:prepilin-type N-terminal cleavage/methylation domain-containing protein
MHIRSFAAQGFTLLEVIITSGIIVILATIVIPSYIKYRAQAAQNICIQNLSQIEAIKQTWGLETRKTTGDQPQDGDLFGLMGYMRSKPVCPAGGDYTLNPVGVNAVCSYPGHLLTD